MDCKNNPRRKFLKAMSGGIAYTLALNPFSKLFAADKISIGPRARRPNPFVAPNGKPLLVCVEGRSYPDMLRAGLEALGGLDLIVDYDSDVLIKPNLVNKVRYPSTCTPDSIKALVLEVKKLTAGTVSVGDQGWYSMDDVIYPFFDLKRKVASVGGTVQTFNQVYQVRRDNWPDWVPDFEVYSDVYDSSVIINFCTLKRHFETSLTCSIKNLFGTVSGPLGSGTRRNIHLGGNRMLNDGVAEVAALINPELNIVDARRLMTVFGPIPNETTVLKDAFKIVLSGDMVATDVYCANLMEEYDSTFSASMIDPILGRAEKLGLGTSDLSQVEVIELDSTFHRGSETSDERGDAGESIPKKYELLQNYPNPFNASTTIRFAIPERSPVVLKVFDSLGREIAVLVQSVLDGGIHSVTFNAGGLASGIYHYRLVTPQFRKSMSMILVK